MEILCFICKNKFNSIEGLMAHIKVYHVIDAHIALRCSAPNCYKTCPSLRAFKRHLLKCSFLYKNCSQKQILSSDACHVIKAEQSHIHISNTDQHVLESNISDSNSISVYDVKKALVVIINSGLYTYFCIKIICLQYFESGSCSRDS